MTHLFFVYWHTSSSQPSSEYHRTIVLSPHHLTSLVTLKLSFVLIMLWISVTQFLFIFI